MDGEIVAHSPLTNTPNFAELQQRFGRRPSPELLAQVPVHYLVFDLLELDGEPTTGLPYLRRRELLAGLELASPRLSVPPHQIGIDPHTLLDIAAQHDLEGCRRQAA
jgi:bifunctional non-homologous end joining protein LigD